MLYTNLGVALIIVNGLTHECSKPYIIRKTKNGKLLNATELFASLEDEATSYDRIY